MKNKRVSYSVSKKKGKKRFLECRINVVKKKFQKKRCWKKGWKRKEKLAEKNGLGINDVEIMKKNKKEVVIWIDEDWGKKTR